MSARSVRRAAIIIGASLVILAPAATAIAAPAKTAQVAPSGQVLREAAAPPLSQIRQSVDLITSTFHVSQAEAIRRLELQRDASGLADRLAQQLPNAYAGMSIDQQHGGVLVISATNPALITGAIRNFPQRGYVRTRKVAYSLRQLDQTASLLQRRYNPHTAVVWANPDDNHVVVSGSKAVQADVRALSSAWIPDRAMIEYQPYPAITNASCSVAACDPPMRGGTELDTYNANDFPAGLPVNLAFGPKVGVNASAAESICTTGFNVRGSNGFAYLLTAGHCVLQVPLGSPFSTPATYTASPDSNVSATNQWLGSKMGGYASDATGADGALLPYIDGAHAGFWLPGNGAHNLVYSKCLSGSCSSNAAFPITTVHTAAEISPGWAVCATGERTGGTRCGFVQGHALGGFTSQICILEGDSGGPWFSQVDNAADGITEAFATGKACGSNGYFALFSAVSTILSQAQSATGHSFHIITTASG
jgi:streptogrisin C